MPETPNDKRDSGDRGKPAEEATCPSCGTVAAAEARFCSACGAVLEAKPSGGTWSAGRLAGLAAVIGVIAVAVYAAVTLSERDEAPPSSAMSPALQFDAPPASTPGAPPDLSQMTPREAADHLFNRIMMASEQGKYDEALRFVPMAVQAYGNLPDLDLDAHFHLGLIHGVAGDTAAVDRQIAVLRESVPNHLLALVLEHRNAERSGDQAAAARILATFAAAYDAEIATRRPEYEAHRNTIERFRLAAEAPSVPSAAEPAAAGQ